ncbi:hypothetical protein BJ170DRAFT_644544 [Xylariales sp. AK1849]|nr:hypothetical protein BJ170DRAFT_644544 [Xylariales sp. AK1849]
MANDAESSTGKSDNPLTLLADTDTDTYLNSAHTNPHGEDEFHIVVCGLLGVGKQCVVCRIVRDQFHYGSGITMSHFMHADYDATRFTCDGKIAQAHFDSCQLFPALEDNLGSISWYIGTPVQRSDAIIQVHDVTNRESFMRMQVLHRLVRALDDYKPEGCDFCYGRKLSMVPSRVKPVIIMANKCELPEKIGP